MPTEIEIRVMKVLDAIEIPPDAAQKIQQWGNEAVTVVCEAALGTYPGLRPKVRNNAVALLGWMDHAQAIETIPLLVNDPNSDVSLRAMRAAGRQKNEQVIEKLNQILKKSESPPLTAAEAVKALMAIDSAKARARLEEYIASSSTAYPHRGNSVVEGILEVYKKQ